MTANDENMVLETFLTIENLTESEELLYNAMVDAAKEKALPEAERIRTERIKGRAPELAEKQGISLENAEKVLRSQYSGQLKSDDLIQFQNFGSVSVHDINKNPSKYDKNSCCDPIEPEEGSRKAIFYWNENNGASRPLIFSQLHGGITYHLQNNEQNFECVEDDGEDEDTPQKTPGDVIHELSDLLQNNNTISADQWFKATHEGKLDNQGVEEVLAYLVSKNVGKKRFLKNEYNIRKAQANFEKAKKILKHLAGKRHIVKYNELNMNRTARLTEKGIIEVPGEWLYFNFGGTLSYAVYDKPAGSTTGVESMEPPQIPVIKQYSKHALQLRIEQSVLHYKEREDTATNEKIPYQVPTPMEIGIKIYEHPEPLAPKVVGLLSHPIIDTCGRIVDQEGIDKKTGLLLQFGGAVFKSLSESPSKEDATVAAKNIFTILFSEFKFKESSVKTLFPAAALSFLLTGIIRKGLDQAPGYKIEANVQGTGKTTLSRIIHVILTGRDMPVSTIGNNSEEQRKEMLASLLQNPAMITYDNVLDGSEIRDPTIAKVITSQYFKNRILGKSQEVTVPTNTLIAVTGNNITLSADLVRRFVTIALTTDREQPENKIFKKPEVVQHCVDVRQEIIRDCLTIVKAYIDNGSPLHIEDHGSSGFHQWDQMVRFPLLWAIGVDVLEAIKLNRERSTEQVATQGVMECLYKIYGDKPFSTTELLEKITLYRDCVSTNEVEDNLRECLSNLSVKSLKSTRSLGWVLRKMIGRMQSGRILKYETDKHGNFGKFYIKS